MATIIKPEALQGRQTEGAVVKDHVPLNIRTVDVDGVRLRVATRAGKGRPLVLFNGIGANLDLLQPFAEALDEVALLIFDLPGAGGSPPLKLPRRLSCLARLSERLLDRLGYTAPVNVAGVSWGGALAQQFAIDYPERTNRLILGATSAGAVAIPARLRVLMRLSTPWRYFSPEYLARVAPELYGGLTRRRPDLVARHVELTRCPSVRGYAYQLYAIMGWTSVHKLPRLRCPTLVMAGDDDPITPVINSRLLHWLIPKSYLHVVHGGGHLFAIVRANESAGVVRRFLNERRYDGTDPQDYVG